MLEHLGPAPKGRTRLYSPQQIMAHLLLEMGELAVEGEERLVGIHRVPDRVLRGGEGMVWSQGAH